jgi:hypothetical protein
VSSEISGPGVLIPLAPTKNQFSCPHDLRRGQLTETQTVFMYCQVKVKRWRRDKPSEDIQKLSYTDCTL